MEPLINWYSVPVIIFYDYETIFEVKKLIIFIKDDFTKKIPFDIILRKCPIVKLGILWYLIFDMSIVIDEIYSVKKENQILFPHYEDSKWILHNKKSTITKYKFFFRFYEIKNHEFKNKIIANSYIKENKFKNENNSISKIIIYSKQKIKNFSINLSSYELLKLPRHVIVLEGFEKNITKNQKYVDKVIMILNNFFLFDITEKIIQYLKKSYYLYEIPLGIEDTFLCSLCPYSYLKEKIKINVETKKYCKIKIIYKIKTFINLNEC